MSLRNLFTVVSLILVFVILGLRSSYEQSIVYGAFNEKENLTGIDVQVKTPVDKGSIEFSYEKVSVDDNFFIEHIERPSVLTIYLMDENGDPTEVSAEIYWESEREKGSVPVDGDRVKLELYQGDYLVRARFKEKGRWRYSLPILIDLEPQDDEELDLIMQPAMVNALQANFVEGPLGFQVESSKGKFFKTGDVLQLVNQCSIAKMRLEDADMLLGNCLQEGQVTLLVESSNSKIKELKIK